MDIRIRLVCDSGEYTIRDSASAHTLARPPHSIHRFSSHRRPLSVTVFKTSLVINFVVVRQPYALGVAPARSRLLDYTIVLFVEIRDVTCI